MSFSSQTLFLKTPFALAAKEHKVHKERVDGKVDVTTHRNSSKHKLGILTKRCGTC